MFYDQNLSAKRSRPIARHSQHLFLPVAAGDGLLRDWLSCPFQTL